MGSDEPKAYNDSSHPSIYNPSWMQSIPDSTRLSQMTIPGTHNSLALHGICCARTQSWSLPEQMKAGLRYFDIRLRLYNNTLRAFHAFVDQKDTFDIILSYVLRFLEENPSESIILQIIKEHKDKNCTKKISELYNEYIQNITDKIIEYQYKDNIEITMGEMRGKILVIKIFGGSTKYYPGFLIQNNWSVNSRFSINEKKRKIKENFHRALFFTNNNKIFLNYLSSSSDYALMTPYSAAKKCNKIALRYQGRLGIVLMDYPGELLIKHLIEQNLLLNNNKNNLIDKTTIKNGDLVYIIHNDTQKYLNIDMNNIKNNEIYCGKNAIGLTIKHKLDNINRDYFMENDDIILVGRNNFQYEFKITDIYNSEDKIIYDKSFFKLQIGQGDEIKFLENKYENKNNNKQYLFNITKKPNNFASYFTIQKVLE